MSLVPGACLVHSLPAKNVEEENSAVENYYQCGPATDLRSRALLDLIDQVSWVQQGLLRFLYRLTGVISCGTALLCLAIVR